MKIREHYTSIAPHEDDHEAALCGCKLIRSEDDGIVRLYFCSTHEAASDMREMLGDLAAAFNDIDELLDSWVGAGSEGLSRAEKLVQREANRVRDRALKMIERARP